MRKRSASFGGLPVLQETNINTSQIETEVKLPKLNIPPFSGDYTEWQSFFDLYTSAIHDKETLSAAQKFQYLKGMLKGEAAALIRHFNITEANYIEAFQKLCQRYSRKRHTVNAFIKTFIEQPSISQANSQNVCKLMDTSDEVIRGLKALGTKATERDPWIIYILLSKLDSETKAQWAQEAIDQDYPSFEGFIKFLGKRVDALESIKASMKTIQPKKYQTHTHATIAVREQCSICNNGSHGIYECTKFKEMPYSERVALVKTTNRCFNCLSPTHRVYDCRVRTRCQKCSRKHHTVLHEEGDHSLSKQTAIPESSKVLHAKATNVISESQVCLKVATNATAAVLPTAEILIRDAYGEIHKFRALLDSASQTSFISESCAQFLKLSRVNGRILVQGIGQTGLGHTRGCVELSIESAGDTRAQLVTKAFVMPRIGYQYAECEISHIDNDVLSKLELADSKFNESGAIDVLLGVDIFLKVIQNGKVTLSNGLVALNTSFGWIIAGQPGLNKVVQNFNVLLDIDRSLHRFWEVEEIQKKIQRSDEENKCEQIFRDTTIRNTENRFTVKLPFRQSPEILGSSYNSAMNRLRAMERRFQRNKDFAELYKQFMKEYESLGHMTLVRDRPNINKYFLPHHGVIKASSATTKLRVVFDASAKSSTGLSLNDVLMVGPVVQSPLINILLRFRQHEFVVTGDIEKMYRQVRVCEDDCQYQKILWRCNESEPVRAYQLNTVTYGTGPASFLATRALTQVGEEIQSQYPEAANAIKYDVYVDDLMTGSNNKEQLQAIMGHVINSFNQSGFNLRKLQSNNRHMQNSFKESEQSNTTKMISQDDDIVSVLGLFWNSDEDNFLFATNISEGNVNTKRELLSTASKVFDPLGWLAPLTIRATILFQSLWAENIDWDDSLPAHVRNSWSDLENEIRNIGIIKIPRWLQTRTKIRLHGFSDASEKAYAAVVYAVDDKGGNNGSSTLIIAKTKVSPVKQLSIPRLELMGALLLTQLMTMVKESITLEIQDMLLWTDSQIVLDWLSDHPRKWTTFVGNRTSEIVSKYQRSHWRHVPSNENPADLASRGLALETLSSSSLWWQGPPWLTKDESCWPKQRSTKSNIGDIEERKSLKTENFIINTYSFIEEFSNRFSNAYTATRVFALVMRYVYNIRAKTKGVKAIVGTISRPELISAENKMFQALQELHFKEELTLLKGNQALSKRSKLISLNPFVDDHGIMRVGGRIQKSIAPYTVKHPIILPNSSLTKLIILDLHQFHHHAGISLLLSLVRRKFWVIRCKDMVKAIVRKCVKCFRQNPKQTNQIMGNLPESRVTYTHPFHQVGVDYCGPFRMHISRKRGQQPIKGYVCIFICLSTKAIHIEVASSLSTDSFLGAFKRFIARRGVCDTIFSDNGTNFVGARNELREIFNFLKINTNEISSFFSKNRINWKFNPPAAPHMGGIWESAVKLVKVHLKRVVGDTIITVEEFSTLMTQIEAVVNSRPICANTSEDIDALTPSHFLIGRVLTDMPEVDVSNTKISPNERWKLITQMKQHFCSRWHKDYLRSLQKRPKWHNEQTNLKENDIVIMIEDNIPSTSWNLAKVIKTHPGDDGKVRVVTIKVGKSGKMMQRPINKLCKLPDYSIESGDSRPPGNGDAAEPKMKIKPDYI